jgi:hypothetical protein
MFGGLVRYQEAGMRARGQIRLLEKMAVNEAKDENPFARVTFLPQLSLVPSR